jgi:regulator of sigma E protease
MKGFLMNEDTKDPSNFVAKSIWQRFTILFAGPLFNVLLSYLLLIFVFWLGVAKPIIYTLPPVIGKIAAPSEPFQEKDLILEVGKKPVSNWEEVYSIAVQHPKNKDILITIKRANQILEVPAPRTIFSQITPLIEPIVGKIFKNSAAEKIGLQVGDRLLAINGEKVTQWSDISDLLQRQGASQSLLLLDRGGRKIELPFQASRQSTNQKWVLGIALPSPKTRYSFLQSFGKAIEAIYNNITTTYTFLVKLLVGKSSSDAVGGPITIFATINQSIDQGFANLLYITAIISLQLAIFNLLPIPALDGGHIALLLAEKIKGKPLSVEFRKKFHFVGFALLMTLLVFVTTKDIGRFWG